MLNKPIFTHLFILFAALFFVTANALTPNPPVTDVLPSWNEGPVKQSIIQFVHLVTDKTGPSYVAPEERIATFDNDGTLWVEQPFYTQAIFALDRLKTLAAQHPEWKTQKPFSIILSGDRAAIAKLSMKDFAKIIAVTHSGMTVEDFYSMVNQWLATSEHPRFKRHYTDLVYQPMLEVMQYLRANDFKVYIVTGGGQDFVRAFSKKTYNVEHDHVIGTAGKTKYIYQNKQPALIKQPELLFIDDKAGKPESINLFITRKPIIAFGNSIGDQQMLEWTQSGDGKRLMLLVHHDDAQREYAYGPNSKVGTFSNALMAEANARGWEIISMQHDWKVIFANQH